MKSEERSIRGASELSQSVLVLQEISISSLGVDHVDHVFVKYRCDANRAAVSI